MVESPNKRRRYLYKVTNCIDGSLTLRPGNSHYLRYEDGTIVEAKNGTVGIFLFKSYKDATRYASLENKIKRVIPIGKVSTMKYAIDMLFGLNNGYAVLNEVIGPISENKHKWIYKLKGYALDYFNTPIGTCVCDKIHVICTIGMKR